MAQGRTIEVERLVDDQQIKGFNWAILITCFIVTLIDGFDIQAAPAAGPFLVREWHLASPAELTAHAAIIYAREGGSWSFRQGATEVSVNMSGQLRVSAAEGVRAAVLADMGLAVASAWMFSPELASGAVQRVLSDWSLPPIDLWAVYPTGRMPGAKARAFVGFLAKELSSAHSLSE